MTETTETDVMVDRLYQAVQAMLVSLEIRDRARNSEDASGWENIRRELQDVHSRWLEAANA